MIEEFRSMLSLTATAAVLIVATVIFLFSGRDNSNIPLANPPGTFSLRIVKQIDFFKHGMEILQQSRKKYGGSPFRVLTPLGDVIILPPRFAHPIRNAEEKDMSFAKAIKSDFHGHVPGFKPFVIVDHEGQILQSLARKQLTKFLKPLSQETTFATNLIYGNSPEWKDIPLQDSVLSLIARLSSRIFIGEEICRNEDWLAITKAYTIDSFKAAIKINVVPHYLKTPVSYFSKSCRTVRAQCARSQEIIQPVIDSRRALKDKARRENQPIPVFNDALEWAEEELRGKAPINDAHLQLMLSVAAIHTTTDLIAVSLLLFAQHPDYIDELREEMVRVMKAEGWKKSALFNMKLLDSAIKEAQRYKPMVSMRRVAMRDITLDEGVFVRKGQYTMVDSYGMQDPTIHENPEKFDIYRFMRMRETPGGANKAQLVTTSPDHLAFGHGKHACPGRFFAANEVKIALIHLLLKYDWEVAPGSTTDLRVVETGESINPETRLRYRRRKEEIDLESLDFNEVAARMERG